MNILAFPKNKYILKWKLGFDKVYRDIDERVMHR